MSLVSRNKKLGQEIDFTEEVVLSPYPWFKVLPVIVGAGALGYLLYRAGKGRK